MSTSDDDEPPAEASAASVASEEASLDDASGSTDSEPDAPSSTEARGAEGWTRWASIAVIGVLAIGMPLWLRAAIDGSAELGRADAAASREDPDAEIEHLGRALRWRAPLLGHDEEALERLWALGQRFEQQGEAGRPLALAAYREVRRGLLSTRVVGVPHEARFEAANDRIAILMTEQEVEHTPASEERPDRAAREQVHRGLLSTVPGPDPVRGHLAALAFAGWLLALVGFITRGLDPRGRLRPRPALRWGAGALLLLVAWAVLLATSHGSA